MSYASRVAMLAVTLATCAGCSTWLPGGTALKTKADQRVIIETKVGDRSTAGHIAPAYVHCAEPSPDIAVAVSRGFGLGASGSATLPQGVTPEVAFSISSANAQAIAQLTERLATIQLLRDGLHRACEAYANGAISDTTYAIMLSRFDKMMVSMLYGELAAGAFGRSLAALGTAATGLSSSGLDKQRSFTVPGPSSTAPSAPGAAPAAATPVPSSTPGTQASGHDVLQSNAQTSANTTAIIAAGQIVGNHSAEAVKTLGDMQKRYMDNLNFDAVEVACVSALDRGFASVELKDATAAYAGAIKSKQDVKAAGEKLMDASRQAGLSGLGAFCLSNLLPTIFEGKQQWVSQLIARDTNRAKRAESRAQEKEVVNEVTEYVTSIKSVLDTYGTLTKPAEDKTPKPAPTAFTISGVTVVETGDPLVVAVAGTGLTGMTALVPQADIEVKAATLAIVRIGASAARGLKQIVFENGGKPLMVALPADAIPAVKEDTAAPKTKVSAGGVSADGIKKVQTALNRLANKLDVDGKLGPKTVAALKQFQKGEGLPVTGKIDDITLARLFLKSSSRS